MKLAASAMGSLLWWVPAGHRPSVQEAVDRLECLRRHGETPDAFTFKRLFPPPGSEAKALPESLPDECPAT
jgi:uncharacterized protein DUF3291